MSHLNLQPKMVGREEELKELLTYLDRAAEGEGSTIFISGEAGIGKTRLVEELKQIARERGFQILLGNCMYESLTPFMPIYEALRSGGLESLFLEETPKVEAVYLVTNAGILMRDVVREETELNPDVFASMFATVTDFLNESLSTLSGKEEKGGLNSLGYQNYRILIENHRDQNLVVILTGKENEFLLNDMREILLKITKTFSKTLEEWGGDEKKVAGIEEILKPLITSGKYDGIYYGKDDPKIRRNLLFENVFLGLSRFTRKSPTLLCIEDLQWIDPSSLALIHYVARNTKDSGLLILGTYRPEDIITSDEKDHPLVKIMQLMDRENLYEMIELERLTKGAINEFINDILGKIDFADELGIRVFKETEGNPLFVIQLIRYMIDERIILNDRGRWILTMDLKDINIPSKIFSVIERRLDRLEKNDRKILDYASVIGEVFNSLVLTDALNINRTNLLERLRDLEQTHRLIHYHNRVFKFDHAKIKEFIYREIPEELREDYHRIIADSIENLYRNNIDGVIGDLAFHYYQCKNRDKALIYLAKAAEKAKKDFSNEEVIRFYNNALELEGDKHKKREILIDLGDTYEILGKLNESLNSYKNSLKLTEDPKIIARIKVKIGQIHERRGKYRESVESCYEALELVKDHLCKEKADAIDQIGKIQMINGEYENALENLNKGLELHEKINDEKGAADCLNHIANMYDLEGEYDLALDHFRRSKEKYEKIGDQRGISKSLNNIAYLLRFKGEYDKGLEYLNESIDILKKIGNHSHIAYKIYTMGRIYIYKGDYDMGLECMQKCLKLSEEIGDQLYIGSCLGDIGIIHMHKGEYDQAISNLKKCIEIYEKIGDTRWVGEYYSNIAEVYIKRKELKKSLDFCKKAYDLAKDIDQKEGIARTNKIYGMVYREQEKWKESSDNFNQSIEIFKDIKMMNELAESYFEFGLMWKAKGEPHKAIEHLNDALYIFKKMKLETQSEKVKVELNTLH